MRDDQRGLARGHAAQLGLDGALVGRVQRRSGFIEDEDGRVLEQGARDGHALLFAARKLEATLAHHGLVAQRRACDEIVDVRGTRRLLDLLRAGTRAAIGDVVAHGVVEEHGVLRHDADCAAHAVLRDLAQVLPGDLDAPTAYIVKAIEQARQRGLARARRADHGHGLAGRDFETEVVQNFAPTARRTPCHIPFRTRSGLRVVAEAHMFEAHGWRTRRQHQVVGARAIGHFARTLEQRKHLVDVGQTLLDLAVEHAQEIERNIELDHERIDHDQITQRQPPAAHALGGAPQHGHEAGGDDELLPGVEQAQAELALHGCTPVFLEVLVVTAGLESLVVEVLDGLVIEQRIDGAAVRRRIELIHAAAEMRAPLGHRHGEGDVGRQRGQRDPEEGGIKAYGQQAQHQRELDQRGQDAVERIRDERMHGARATLDVARHAAGLPLQVEAQAEVVQVAKDLQRQRAGRALGGLGKDDFAQLGKE